MIGRGLAILALIAIPSIVLHHDYRVFSGVNEEGDYSSAPSQLAIVAAPVVDLNKAMGTDAAANLQCPKEDQGHGYNSAFKYNTLYPDENGICINDQNVYRGSQVAAGNIARTCLKRNLYGKPCKGNFVEAYCRKANFCDGTMPGSKCYSNGEWGACKETGVPVAPGGTTSGCDEINDPLGCKVLIEGGSLTDTEKPVTLPPSGQQPAPAPATDLPPNTAGNRVGAAFNPTPSSVAGAPSTQSTIPSWAQANTTGVIAPGFNASIANPLGPQAVTGPALGSVTTLQPTGPYAAPARPSDYYSAYPPQPTTFGKYTTPPAYNAPQPTGSGFASSFASLLSNLLSIPSQTVTNVMQIFIPAPASAPVNDRVVILSSPAPKPTRPIVISYDVDPTAQADTLGPIIAAANRQENASRTPSLGEKISAQTAASSSVVSSDLGVPRRPGLEGLGNDIVQSQPGTRVQESASASTSQGTSSRTRTEVVLVDLGVAVDIGEAATIDSIIANLNGRWTRQSKAPSQYKAALAQAQANYDAVVAQIGALQDALNAGVCDEACAPSLSSLQGELSVRRSHIDSLATIVREDESSPRPMNPPPTVAQIARVVERVTPVYASGSGPPASVNIGAQESPRSSGEVPGEAIVLRVVKNIWKTLTSWFEPRAQAPTPKKPCSLFLSLFGMCT